MAVLAALMYFRMHAEVINALGPSAGTTAIIIGLALATVSVLANTMVIGVHALDGSTRGRPAGRPRGRGRQGPLSEERRLNREGGHSGSGARGAGPGRPNGPPRRGITEAGRQRAASDQLINAGRAIHQGVGPLSEPAVDPNGQDGVLGYRRTETTPEVDKRPMRLCLEHVSTPLPGEQSR